MCADIVIYFQGTLPMHCKPWMSHNSSASRGKRLWANIVFSKKTRPGQSQHKCGASWCIAVQTNVAAHIRRQQSAEGQPVLPSWPLPWPWLGAWRLQPLIPVMTWQRPHWAECFSCGPCPGLCHCPLGSVVQTEVQTVMRQQLGVQPLVVLLLAVLQCSAPSH